MNHIIDIMIKLVRASHGTRCWDKPEMARRQIAHPDAQAPGPPWEVLPNNRYTVWQTVVTAVKEAQMTRSRGSQE